MMQENNLLDRNGTNDIQGVKLTYALVILISSIEIQNQLSYHGSTIIPCKISGSWGQRFLRYLGGGVGPW